MKQKFKAFWQNHRDIIIATLIAFVITILCLLFGGDIESHADFFSDDTNNGFYQYIPYAPEMISIARERSRAAIAQGVYTVTQPAEYRDREVFYDSSGHSLASLNVYPDEVSTNGKWGYQIAFDVDNTINNYDITAYFAGFPIYKTGHEFDYFNDSIQLVSGGTAPDYATIKFNLYVPDQQIDYNAATGKLSLNAIPLTIYPGLVNNTVFYVQAIRDYLSDTYFGVFDSLYVGDVTITFNYGYVDRIIKINCRHTLFRDTLTSSGAISYFARTKFANWTAYNPPMPLPRVPMDNQNDPITSLLMGVDKFLTMPIFGASWLTFGNLILVMFGVAFVPLIVRVWR